MSAGDEKVTIRYDRARKLYYVTEFLFFQPTIWLALEKGEDDKYAVYPFAFYEIKSGSEEAVSPDHELVLRYAEVERWPSIGSVAFLDKLERYRASMERLKADADRQAAYYAAELAKCDVLATEGRVQ